MEGLTMDEDITFQHYEQCWDSKGWMFLKAWYYDSKRDKWLWLLVDD
jgi:hypothetical protein